MYNPLATAPNTRCYPIQRQLAWLKGELRICVAACASEPLVVVREASKAGETWIWTNNGLGAGGRRSKRHKRNRQPTLHCGADVSGIVAWVVGLDFETNPGRTHGR